MHKDLLELKSSVYDQCSFVISDFTTEQESHDYNACRFKLNDLAVISRTAKITPKKSGQFVTFWKRKENGPIEPLHENDLFDFYIVNIRFENHFGQYVFPKSILVKKGIVSTHKKEGKRAFRVYPPWDIINSQQAEKAQKWQLAYFYFIDKLIDLNKVKQLYQQYQ